MKRFKFIVFMVFFLLPIIAQTADSEQLQRELLLLRKQTAEMQKKLSLLQQQLDQKSQSQQTSTQTSVAKSDINLNSHSSQLTSGVTQSTLRQTNHSNQKKGKSSSGDKPQKSEEVIVSKSLSVHMVKGHPDSIDIYPAALIADDHVVTYLSGMPVVTSPYLGERPAFDGSDYMVNISSINRDIRLMQQRRRLYRSFDKLDYPKPNLPILSISGKTEPLGSVGRNYSSKTFTDWDLGSSELDFSAAVNESVEAYVGIAYDSTPLADGTPRVFNSRILLNTGFISIGDLDRSPLYLTAGQLYVPFGRYSSSMISSPLTQRLARIKTRPIIFGYKSQEETGPFAAIYGYSSDTTMGSTAVGGLNLGYVYSVHSMTGELGVSLVSSLDDATGMQYNNTSSSTNFAGFASPTNGNELVAKIPGVDVHLMSSYERYNLTLEWVSSIGRFRTQDLSFNGVGAQPQALQAEGGFTFTAFDKPASLSASYQWTKDTLALNLPNHRISGVFNISIWKDTVESLEYRHDIDFNTNQYANGSAPAGSVNTNTVGTGGQADTVLLQLGVYF